MKNKLDVGVTTRGWYAANCPELYLQRCLRDMPYIEIEKLLNMKEGSIVEFTPELRAKAYCVLSLKYADEMILQLEGT